MQLTGLQRSVAKTVNFGHIYGMGVQALAATLGVSQSKAQEIYDQYDRELPFAKSLAKVIERGAEVDGFTLLYGGYRRHWKTWVPKGADWAGEGPCSREEADRRRKDSSHPWFGCQLKRADTRTALNALIQGSAAVHTKRWMLACWREGITPLLQLHDSLELSVASPKQAERVAQLGCEAVKLAVPMRVGLKFGRTWGDAMHTWQELHGCPAPIVVEAVPLAAAESERMRDDPIVELLGEPVQVAAPIPPIPPPFARQAEEQPVEQSHSNTRGKPANGNGYGYPWGEDNINQEVAEFIYRDLKGAPYLKVVKHKTKPGRKSFPQYHWENGTLGKRQTQRTGDSVSPARIAGRTDGRKGVDLRGREGRRHSRCARIDRDHQPRRRRQMGTGTEQVVGRIRGGLRSRGQRREPGASTLSKVATALTGSFPTSASSHSASCPSTVT